MLATNLPEASGASNPKSTTKRGKMAIITALGRTNVRAKLTPDLIKELRPPTDRAESFIWDSTLPGWGIRILASGTMSWITQVRIRGRPISPRRTYGRVGLLPFTIARQRAQDIIALAQLGRDWHAEEAARIAAEQAAIEAVAVDHTLGARLGEYLADPEVRKLRTFPAIERYLTKVWAPLHDADANSITSKDLTTCLERVAVNSGLVTANRARSTLGAVFKSVLKTHRLERDGNPVRGPGGGKSAGGGLGRRTWTSWPRSGGPLAWFTRSSFGAVVRLLVLTAARRNEIAMLTDPNSTWGAQRSSCRPIGSRRASRVGFRYSQPAVRLLRGLPERKGQRLFPVVNWTRCKRELDAASGVCAWVLHDLQAIILQLGSRSAAHRWRGGRARSWASARWRAGQIRVQRASGPAARSRGTMGAAGAGGGGGARRARAAREARERERVGNRGARAAERRAARAPTPEATIMADDGDRAQGRPAARAAPPWLKLLEALAVAGISEESLLGRSARR